MQVQNNKLNFAGQNIYVGIDTHLKSWKVTIMHEKIVHKTFVQDPEPEILAGYLKKNYPGANYYSAYEASFCGFWIHNQLEKLGLKNIVVNPADIPTTDKEKKQKEDRRDSRKIARTLENGELRGIYIPGEKVLGDRTMLRLREKLSGDLARYKCKMKSLLYFHGIKFPEEFEDKSHWSKKFIKWIEELDFKNESSNQVRDSYLKIAKGFCEEMLTVTRQIKKLSQTEKYKKNAAFITSVPGIGLITGMTFLTEIDRIERFFNIDHLSSYVGVVPSTASSGDKEIVRGITPRKNKRLRKMLIEGSWIAIRRDPALSLAYANYVKKMEPNKAIVKIARKLLNRISNVLRTQKKYETCVVK